MTDKAMTDKAMTDSDLVLLDVGDDGVGLITLNRPEQRNGWNPELERRFYAVLDAADTDDRIRACVLTGAGKTFCPGVDSGRLDRIAGVTLDLSNRITVSHTLAFRKPLIAAINGGCAGMGLVQALMCDVRFAARGAKFTTAFARRGLAGEYGATWLLPRLIGTERALDLLLSARTFDADEALALGVVSRVVEREDLLSAARAYAADIAANCSPASLAMIKHQVLTDFDAGYESAMRSGYRAMHAVANGVDFREGIDSYLQRRPPQFAPLAADFRPGEITGVDIQGLDVDPDSP
jgi:enoyl-CoA hydratase/carnithine racemase